MLTFDKYSEKKIFLSIFILRLQNIDNVTKSTISGHIHPCFAEAINWSAMSCSWCSNDTSALNYFYKVINFRQFNMSSNLRFSFSFSRFLTLFLMSFNLNILSIFASDSGSLPQKQNFPTFFFSQIIIRIFSLSISIQEFISLDCRPNKLHPNPFPFSLFPPVELAQTGK